MPPENNQVPQPSSQSITEAAPSPAPVKIGKFAASKLIVKESWAVLRHDKEIMWFPVMTSIFSLIALALIGIVFFFIAGGTDVVFSSEESSQVGDILLYSFLFVYYIAMFFILNYFQAGLFIIVQGRFGGQNLSFGDGVRGANKFIGKIFIWSVISATVGVILRIIADKSAVLGKIVATIFGAAWNILTYFSLPSLVIGNLSIKDSFKESARVIRKTWGETIIINFGVGLFFMLIFFALFALSIGVIIIAPSITVMLSVAILLVLSIIGLSIISTTLNSIFKLALFNYARTGQVPQGFSPEVVRGAVVAKNK